jgi:antirestriction protein
MQWLEMDATHMTFEDESFEVVIDKGTLDALMCAKDLNIIKNIIQEMTRVLTKQGQLFVVSHGNPDSRRVLFKNCINLDDYEFYFSKQNLSDYSQLINIFRAKLKDKPLSHILKDKDALKESLKEYSKYNFQQKLVRLVEMKKKRDAEQEEEKKINTNNENKSEKYSSEIVSSVIDKVADVIEQKQIAKDVPKESNPDIILANKDGNEPPNASGLNSEPSNIAQVSNNESKMEPLNSEDKNVPNVSENTPKPTPSTSTSTYEPKRQPFCYVYNIRKL